MNESSPGTRHGPPMPGSDRRAWGTLALGLGIGGIVTAIGFVLVGGHGHVGATPPAEDTYVIDKDTLRLKPDSIPMRFDTAKVERGVPLARPPSIARIMTVEARTSPSFAPLDGRVVEVAVHLGDHVKEGDKMILVRSGDLAGMQRELAAADLTIRTKQALATRMRALVESRAAAANELLVAESEVSEAKLASSAAASKLRSLAVQPGGDSSYWILAPRAGTVVQLDAVRGKQVGPDKDKPVATVADLDEVLVISDVPQNEASSIHPGMAVAVRQPGSSTEPNHGVVDVVSDVLDPDRQTVPVRIHVKNEGHALRPNQFVEATFEPSESEKVLQVPAEAVVTDGATAMVFQQVEPGVLKKRPVHLGRQTKDRVEILSGVNEGDTVVVKGALLLLNAIEIKG